MNEDNMSDLSIEEMNFKVAHRIRSKNKTKINPAMFSFWSEVPNDASKDSETKSMPKKKKDLKHKVTPDNKVNKNQCQKFIGNGYKSDPLIEVTENVEISLSIN